MLVVSSSIVIFILWASITSINEIARAAGEVIPSTYVQSVQHLEGGVVSKISVMEGELVKKGDVLLVIDGMGVKRDLSELQARQLSYKFRV